MAKVSFNNLSEDALNGNQNSNYGNDVGFFTLKNDNDEAIVRFICDSVDDMDIQTIHTVSIDNKYRKVACIRDPREPIDNCPLCKNNTQISQRFFIRLIEYKKVQDPNTGAISIKAEPKVWERSVSYAKTLKAYLENYGPLSDIICKIIRHGKAGDMQTTYEIVPNLSKQIYRDDIYIKDVNMFGSFDTLGSIVMDKNFEEISQFLITGQFPAKPKQQEGATNPAQEMSSMSAPVTNPNGGDYYATTTPAIQTQYNATPNQEPVQQYQPTPQYQATPQYQQPAQNAPSEVTPAAGRQMPWDNAQPQGGFVRPQRY